MSAQILVLAAGAGKRFKDAGYEDPKPLLPVDADGTPMVCAVGDNLLTEFNQDPRDGLLLVRQPGDDLGLDSDIVEVVVEGGLTGGAAETALLAEPHLDPDEPLIIANSDQLFRLSARDQGRSLIEAMLAGALDGFVLTFDAAAAGGDLKRWSYASVDKSWSRMLTGIVEKPQTIPPGSEATVGVYGFARARTAFDAIRAMMAANDRTNGEFYLAPCYNHLPPASHVALVQVSEFVPLGTPDDYEAYLKANGLR